MTGDARTILDPERAVSEWSVDLIGFEPTTAAFNPGDAGEAAQLLKAYGDACFAGTEVRIVKDDDGRLALWTKAGDFWPT